jgi:hypothetical protein
MTGKERHHVRVLPSCRPCESEGGSGVFHQHARGMATKGDSRNPRTMERACFEENETRFGQSEPTPPMQKMTLDKLGIVGNFDAAEETLAGNDVSPVGMDQRMTELLEEMRVPKSILESLKKDGHISTVVSETESKSGWKNAI